MLCIKKVWGEEHVWAATQTYSGKLMRVFPGFQSSLHRHLIKDETFLVLHGQLALEVEGICHHLEPIQAMRIQPGQWHRFTNPTRDIVEFIEVGTPHDDRDVERREISGPLR